MNAAVIKALCRRIEDRYGSNRAVALAAGVQGSVWSDYCNDAKPTCTIPFGRVLLVANREEKVAFAELLIGLDDTPPGDVVDEACELNEDAGALQRDVRLATARGGLTPRTAKVILDEALHAREDVDRVIRDVSRRVAA